MPTYLYTALDLRGVTRQAEITGADRAAAMALLTREGLTVLTLREKGQVQRSRHAGRPFSRVSPLDRILLTRHLASIVRAGVPLGEAIDILIYNSQSRTALTTVLEEAKRGLAQGHPLSSVFAAYPEYFPPVFVGLIKAGENSGTLEETLRNLGNQLLRDYELIRKVRAAMVYPAILLTASCGIIVLLMTFVLPRLASAFGSADVELPFITRAIVGVSGALAAHQFITLLAAFTAAVGGFFFLRSRPGKRLVFAVFRRLPVAKNLLRNLALARFSRTLKNLVKSGIPLIEALQIVAESVGDDRYGAELSAMREELKKGVPFADMFRKREDLFPRLVGSLIAIGERTGSLESALETIADFYDEEVERTLRTLVTLLEPLLLLIMGLVVGGLALAVLLPIYQLVGQLR